MTRRILALDDLDDDLVVEILARASALGAGPGPAGPLKHLGLLFLETSLRTRLGFASAAQRLGWPAPLEVVERRSSEVSRPESLGDTIAVLAAYVDALIVRSDRPISEIAVHVPGDVGLVNGGDRGPTAEHPTQALIDLFAMEQLVGDVSSLRVALCGDLRMRAARSLLKLLERRPPGELVLVTAPELMDGLVLPDHLDHSLVHAIGDVTEVDALHVVGIPHGAVDEDVRSRLRVDAAGLTGLSSRGRVFSPMPVIDEVAHAVRSDHRMAFLAQSRLGLSVRTAVLEVL